MAEISPGDVVQLKSGGPAMTVTEVREDEAYCIWFDGPDKTGDSFPLIVLTSETGPVIA